SALRLLLHGLADAFTRPTYHRFGVLLLAALLTTGNHTILNVLRTVGRLAAEPTLDALGNRALRSRRTDPSGRRRHRRRTSRQESLWQGASSRCRALVALVHGVSLRAQVGRVGRVGPFPVHQPAVGFAGVGGALSEQGPVGEATTQDTVAANAANAQGAVALVSRTYFRLCRRRRLRHARVGPHRGAATVALDADQSFLRRCQSLRAAAGTHRSQDRWSPPRQRGQAAVSRKSRGPQPPAAASERGLVWRRATPRRSGDRHRPLVQGRRRFGAGLVGFRARPDRHPPRRIFLHDRRTPDGPAGDRMFHGSLVDRDDLPRDACLPGTGNDTRPEEGHSAAHGPVLVRLVHRRSHPVRPDAGSLPPRTDYRLGRQEGYDLLRCHHGRAPLAVAGMGFCNTRSSRGLFKTPPPVSGPAAVRPGPGSVR